jgi:hypothetical protein
VIYKPATQEIRKISDVPLVEKHTANKEELKLART